MDIDDSVVVPREPRTPPMVRRQPRRFVRYALRMCTWLLTVIGAVIVVAISVVAYKGVRLLAKTARTMIFDPHAVAFNNTGSTFLPANTVHPFIDLDTKFDLSFCVYARKPNDQQENPEWYSEDWDGGSFITARLGMTLLETHDHGLPVVELIKPNPEPSLLGCQLIHDFTLHQRHKEATVQVQLPLRRFYDPRLYDTDVRGVITLFPSSPSRFDDITNVIDTRPYEAPRFRGADPHRDEVFDDLNENDFKQTALDTLSLSFPLVTFAKSGPDNRTDRASNTSQSMDDRVDKDAEATTTVALQSNSGATNRQQPYLRTYIHAYIINETRSINRFAFEGKLREQNRTSCGRSKSGVEPSVFLCDHDYRDSGHWECAYEMGEDFPKSPLAYPPYLNWIPTLPGPRDVIRLPVNLSDPSEHRGEQWDDKQGRYVDETTNVKFTLRFSTLKPHHSWISKFMAPTWYLHEGHDAMDNKTNAESHDFADQLSGLIYGAKDGLHPWRRFFLGTASLLLNMLMLVLHPLYWYTRHTSAGISRASLAIGCANIAWGLHSVMDDDEILSIVFTGVWLAVVLLVQLKVLLPVAVQKVNGRWTIRRVRPTHRERASRRQEVSRSSVGLILLGAILLQVILHFYPYAWTPKFPLESRPLTSFGGAVDQLDSAAVLSGAVFQITLNARLGTFAGNFAIGQFCACLIEVLEVLGKFDMLGKYDSKDGLKWSSLLTLLSEAVLAYQAATLPRVEQNVQDEDEL